MDGFRLEIEPQLSPDRSALTRAAEQVGTANKLVAEYNVEELLEPYADFFPDTDNPTHAVLSIEHNYGWSAQQVTHVLIDIKNTLTPDIESYDHFVPLELSSGPAPQIAIPNQNMVVTAGHSEKARKFVARPLPDLETESADDSTDTKAAITMDIVKYFSKGVRVRAQQDPKFFEEVVARLEPFFFYIDLQNDIGARQKAIAEEYSLEMAKIEAKKTEEQRILDYQTSWACRDFRTDLANQRRNDQ